MSKATQAEARTAAGAAAKRVAMVSKGASIFKEIIGGRGLREKRVRGKECGRRETRSSVVSCWLHCFSTVIAALMFSYASDPKSEHCVQIATSLTQTRL